MIVYLDTSSLVKLYVSEAGSDTVRRLVDEASVVATSNIAYPEARAAFARRHRERAFTRAGFTSVKRTFESDWPRYLAIDATAGLCREAGEIAERYRLRGYDSVHLASFAEVVRRTEPGQARFSSFDDALNRAAIAYGRRLVKI